MLPSSVVEASIHAQLPSPSVRDPAIGIGVGVGICTGDTVAAGTILDTAAALKTGRRPPRVGGRVGGWVDGWILYTHSTLRTGWKDGVGEGL